MQAMILAAGMGTRMGKYTQQCTKSMITVGGKLLIERTLIALRKAGIKTLVMVLGYEGEKLEKYLRKHAKDFELRIIYNTDYKTTNNIYSLYLAREELSIDDTILLESDLIYDYDVIKDMVESPFENMVAVAKYEQWMDGTVVLLDDNENILDFVEKTDFRFEHANEYYKTVNIYKFSKEFARNQYIPFLETYIKAYGTNQYYELVLKILAHIKYSQMKAFLMGDYDWYEIDNIQDLGIANVIFSEDDKQFDAYDHQYGGFWRFPKLKDFCYLVNPYYPPGKMLDHMVFFYETLLRQYPSGISTQNLNAGRMFHLDESYVLVGNGAAELINVLGNIIEGTLLIAVPVFNEYVRCFTKCNIKKINSHLYGFCITANVIREHLDGVDVVALVNPDNPSGNFINYEDILNIIQECHDRNIRCIVDESFIDFATKKYRYTLLDKNILEDYPNLIVIKSISKSYGVPGLRLGIMATSDFKLLNKIRQRLSIWNINSFAEYFLQIHSLYDNDYYNACDLIALQRRSMEEMLNAIPSIEIFPSEANYIMCHLIGNMNSKDVANILVKKYKILIKDLSNKEGVPDNRYIRVAVKSQEENNLLVEALKETLK